MNMSWSNETDVRHGRKFCCVESVDRPVVMVKFCPSKGKEWLVPWSRFESSNFGIEEGNERMELFFPNLHITVVGYGLRELEKEISTMKVRCLRDLPESHYQTFEPDEPFINRLEVRMVDGSKKPIQENLPF